MEIGARSWTTGLLQGKQRVQLLCELHDSFGPCCKPVTLIQVVAGGRKRRKYRNHERRLVTIKEKYEAGDYTLSELIKAYSHWVSF